MLLAGAVRSVANSDHHTAYYAAVSGGFVLLLLALFLSPSSEPEVYVRRKGLVGLLPWVRWFVFSAAFMAFGFVIPLAVLAGFISDRPDWRKLSFTAVCGVAIGVAWTVASTLSNLGPEAIEEDAE